MVTSAWEQPSDNDAGYRQSRYHRDIALPIRVFKALEEKAKAEEARQREVEDVKARQELPLFAVPKLEDLVYLDIVERDLQGDGSDIPLLHAGDLQAAFQRARHYAGSDKPRHQSQLKALKRIASRGLWRRVLRPSRADVLTELRTAHPNFLPVLDLLEDELCLAAKTGEPMYLPPILLNGPPGCGKTYFAQKLGEAIGTGFVRISLESAQTPAELTGTAEHWSNTKPGRIFDTLIEGDSANPVVLLDEVDKAGGRDEYRADKALYGLLDRESAKVWADQAFPTLPINASYVIWLLTSNDARFIPLPLLSRMRRFDIRPLEDHQARLMVRKIFAAIVEGFAGLEGFERNLDIGLCDMMRFYSPREISRLSRSLIAHAVRDGRSAVLVVDVQAVGASTALIEAMGRYFDEVCGSIKH